MDSTNCIMQYSQNQKGFVNSNKKQFMASAGECVVSECCAVGCRSTYPSTSSSWSYGMFLYTRLTDDAAKKNNVVDSSICSCRETSHFSYANLYLSSANISVNTVNFTDNVCYYDPAVYTAPTVATSHVTASVQYCTVRDNNARGALIIDYNVINANYMLTHTNFISNYQVQTIYGLINTDGPVLVTHCTVLDNDLNASHQWFNVDRGGYYELFDLTIDSDYASHTLGVVYVNFIQQFEGKSFINALKHTEKEGLCEASYDVFGDLKPVIPFMNWNDIFGCEFNTSLEFVSTMRMLEYIFCISFLPCSKPTDL